MDVAVQAVHVAGVGAPVDSVEVALRLLHARMPGPVPHTAGIGVDAIPSASQPSAAQEMKGCRVEWNFR